MSHTPSPAAVGRKEEPQSRGLGREGGPHPGEGASWELSSLLLPGGDVFPGLWGHSAQSQRQRGFPGVALEATAKQPPPVALSVLFLTCAFEFPIRTERLCFAVNRNKTTKASQ